MSSSSQPVRLDPHGEMIMDQYRSLLPILTDMCNIIPGKLRDFFCEAGIIVAAVESRVKTESSLAGKLELKGAKYGSVFDITDTLGLRVITFYNDDVDKIAAVVERLFEIDWENSVDKRKAHDIDSFGYLSLHYICRIPEEAYKDPEHPELNRIRFEIQIRTVLQHAWANMNHDTGYKSGVEVPKAYLRQLSRLAGMLELADYEFSRIRSELSDYRRRIQALVADGNLSEVPLDGDTFRSYLETGPFDALNHKIAALNQAEILDVSLMNFLPLFKGIGMKTLGDIADLIRDYSEPAFQLARTQIGLSDIDIVSCSIGPQNICLAFILKSGGGKLGVRFMLDTLNGPSESNDAMADFFISESRDLPFMNQ